MDEPLLRVENLHKHYPVAGLLPWRPATSAVHAVDGISFEIRSGETLSIVGESGCGKTTTAKLVLRLEGPTLGEIRFRGSDINTLGASEATDYRRNVQVVFQNPFSSLNPRMRIGEIIGEPMVINGSMDRATLRAEVEQLLIAVGLTPAVARSYPHELSGGMRQRVALARALIVRPALIVLDEPVSALDVSIRAQIVNLLKDMQREFGVAYMLIAHDLAATRYLSHHSAVMYLGQIVEYDVSDRLFSAPLHP